MISKWCHVIMVFSMALLPACLIAGDYEDGVAAFEAKDFGTAVGFFQKSAEEGNKEAQRLLALMYHNGQGVKQDDRAMTKWLLKAADQDDAEAQLMLGRSYCFGEGTIQDYTQAHMWFNLACAHGNAHAREARDELAAKMTPSQIAKAQDMAREKTAEIEKRKAAKK